MTRTVWSFRWRAGVWLLLVCMLSACGAPSTRPTSPAPSIAGRWQGSIESATDGPGTVTLQLTQTGLDVSGSVRLSQDGITDVPGTFSGTILTASSATTMEYTVSYQYGQQCAGSFSGTVMVTNGEMTGQYSGRNCVREFTGAIHTTKVD